MGPPAYTPACLFVHDYRPVVEADRRTLVEQPAVGQPPALVTMEDLVDCVVAQGRLLLHQLDRNLHVLVLVHRSQQFGYTARRPREWCNRSNKFMSFLGSYFQNKIGALPQLCGPANHQGNTTPVNKNANVPTSAIFGSIIAAPVQYHPYLDQNFSSMQKMGASHPTCTCCGRDPNPRPPDVSDDGANEFARKPYESGALTS